MKIRITALFLLLAITYGYASTPHSRTIIRFDKDWKFHLGNASNPTKDFNYGISNIASKAGKAENCAIDPKFNDQAWRSLSLPHDWAVELPFVDSPNFDVQSHGYKPVGGFFPETSIGWYRKHFTISKADSGQRFSIQFDGIFRDARIWINGFYLGNNESGYIGITCDITDYIRFDQDNVIVVRVDATQYEGWFYEGAGIYRHVWLIQHDELYLEKDELFVTSEVKDKKATLHIAGKINNSSMNDRSASVFCSVLNQHGGMFNVEIIPELLVKSSGSQEFHATLEVQNPNLWSPANPYLYKITVTLHDKEKMFDSLILNYGIKTVSFDSEKGFFLNGENVKIKGVCCHQDHAGVGVAIPDGLHYYRVRLLKEMGVNAIRMSHNPPTPELLDACDSLGLLVMDETRLLNSSPEYMDQFRRLVKRDRNRASVFMWSIGNEEGYIQTNSIGKRIALTYIAELKKLDPSRTCTYGADLPNYFPGINEVIPVRGFNYRQFAVADYHRDHPKQPIIGTEMGSTVTTRGVLTMDTIRCYLPDQDITAPWWASTAETWWSLCAEQPWWMGGFVWTGFDYRGEPTPFKWPNINSHFGIMDMCGFPKNIYYYYQSWWVDADMIHISPHWNHPGMEGQPIKVWVNTNADSVDLVVNGKSQGIKRMMRKSHLNWEVDFQPGIVEAIAFKGGRNYSTKIETTGSPSKIKLSSYPSSLKANGVDVVVINVEMLDENGYMVPDANQLVKFKIQGSGKIIGVGNGDPSCHEADKCDENKWQRSLFNGRCQLILQAGESSGKILLEATSSGVKSAKLEIPVSSTNL